MRLQIEATAPQAEFLTLQARYRLFCAGYGAGKSEALAQAAIIDACQSSGVLIGCYAPTYDLVRLIVAERIVKKLSDHGVAARYVRHPDNAIYTSAPGWGDFILRTLDNPERIVGYEVYRSHIDELDTLKHEHAQLAWNKVISRNRQRPQGIKSPYNQVSAYTTPEGFRFAHWRWVLNATPEYAMVQAPSYSNPFLAPGYIESLRSTYTPELAEAYIEGRFVNLTSGTVYSAYDRIACRSAETIRHNEPLFIGQDFNVSNMASTVYVKRQSGWHAVAELVGIYDTPALIETLREKYKGHAITIYPDASGTSRKTVDASRSDISLLQQAGFIIRAKSKNPAIKDRVMATNRAFADRRLWVNDSACPMVAGSLERQAYDKNGEPDKSAGHDHQNDATTYPIAYEMPITRPVAHIPITFGRRA